MDKTAEVQRGRVMREVTIDEYLNFVRGVGRVEVEGQVIELRDVEVGRLEPTPEELTDVSTTVWSFPRRGSWATHRGDYRGNWPPQIPRALMLMYTRPGDVVLDPMAGSGTTCIEARLLGRNCIALDISYDAAMLTMHRLYHLERALSRALAPPSAGWVKVYWGDARRLDLLGDESVDLVAAHPPYFDIIEYQGVEGDLSRAGSLEEYLRWMCQAAGEMYRVLKTGRHAAVLIGDTRIHRHYVPISHHVLQCLLRAGFVLKEEVVKIQHRMKATRERWANRDRDFLLIYHEKLYILRKPTPEERERLKYSGYLNIENIIKYA